MASPLTPYMSAHTTPQRLVMTPYASARTTPQRLVMASRLTPSVSARTTPCSPPFRSPSSSPGRSSAATGPHGRSRIATVTLSAR
eukprot:8901910-Lingulodinium_polyedra.AAC.1